MYRPYAFYISARFKLSCSDPALNVTCEVPVVLNEVLFHFNVQIMTCKSKTLKQTNLLKMCLKNNQANGIAPLGISQLRNTITSGSFRIQIVCQALAEVSPFKQYTENRFRQVLHQNGLLRCNLIYIVASFANRVAA